MSTQTQDQHRTAEERLAALGKRIDGVRAHAREDREKVDRVVERRLDAARAKNAEIRTRFRQMAEEDDAAWNAFFTELDRELDELDAEVAVMESQRAAEDAEDWAAFQRAVEEELQAYDELIDASRERAERAKADVRRRSTEAVDRAKEKARKVGEALKRRHDEAARGWAELRDEIRTEMDQVDAAVVEAVAAMDADVMAAMTEGDARR